jgi:hypothetical protein
MENSTQEDQDLCLLDPSLLLTHKQVLFCRSLRDSPGPVGIPLPYQPSVQCCLSDLPLPGQNPIGLAEQDQGRGSGS